MSFLRNTKRTLFLKSLREGKDLTQANIVEKLAEKSITTTKSSVSNWEIGNCPPDEETISALEVVLEMDEPQKAEFKKFIRAIKNSIKHNKKKKNGKKKRKPYGKRKPKNLVLPKVPDTGYNIWKLIHDGEITAKGLQLFIDRLPDDGSNTSNDITLRVLMILSK